MKKLYSVEGILNKGFVGQITYTVCLDKPLKTLDIGFAFDKRRYTPADELIAAVHTGRTWVSNGMALKYDKTQDGAWRFTREDLKKPGFRPGEKYIMTLRNAAEEREYELPADGLTLTDGELPEGNILIPKLYADKTELENLVCVSPVIKRTSSLSENRKEQKAMNKITSFRDEYRFLSNFHQCPFEYRGLTYPNAEAAFQAQKCSEEKDKIKYTLLKNPVRAKQMGKKEPNLPADWDEISYDIMNEILHAKFSVPELAEKLISTGDAYLEEGNHWHDNRWGRCTCEKCATKEGQNQLGKILMGIREELKKQR